MRFIQHEDRETILLQLSEQIAGDNETRLVDAFVDKVDLASHGFTFKTDKGDKADLGGRREYHPADLLKLYVYGYINQVRSSRQLSKHCRINLEVKWLVSNLQPSHNTVNKFRKNNPDALNELFRTFNRFWKQIGLYGNEDIAIDGSFFAAQNGKQHNFSSDKIKKRLAHIDKKTEDYLALLDQIDKEEDKALKLSEEEVAAKLAVLSKRKEKYQVLSNILKESGDSQVSTTDSDARLLSKGKGAQMAYNVQIATEEENKMIAYYEVTNQGDTKAFHRVAKATKDFLQDGDETQSINALGDKGFNDAEQLHLCQQDNITTYVAHKDEKEPKKEGLFTKSKFVYNRAEDTYQCPNDETLKTTGNFFKNRNRKVKSYQVSFKICEGCPLKESCLSPKSIEKRKGRSITRSPYENAKDDNKKRVSENKEIYHLRKAMVEHPFGTIKRQWGYSYTLLKGFKKVSGEFALIFSAYNLRRATSILGVNELLNRINQAEMLVFSLFLKKLVVTSPTSHHRRKKSPQYDLFQSVCKRIFAPFLTLKVGCVTDWYGSINWSCIVSGIFHYFHKRSISSCKRPVDSEMIRNSTPNSLSFLAVS